jgi:aryl-alcohol dehydrogenase-like predicted oxidoreductase
MRYRFLGKTGVQVSEICLGTMTFGNEADEVASLSILDRALEAGINFFDTANVYNGGRTEEIIGRWMPAHREEIILASKAYFPTGSGPNEKGSSRRNIVLSVEKSLRRLNTSWLDMLYLHHWDPNTALEESLAAIDDLVHQGKVLYAAISNFSAWQTMKALSVAKINGLNPAVGIQPMYSLLKRQAEVELLPLALSEGLAVCPYSPMGAGLLSGKYQRGEEGRMDRNEMYRDRYKNPAYRDVSDRFVEYAQSRQLAPASLAIAWVTSHPAITSAIVGARSVEQLNASLASTELSLSHEQRAEISALSIAPPLATDR